MHICPHQTGTLKEPQAALVKRPDGTFRVRLTRAKLLYQYDYLDCPRSERPSRRGDMSRVEVDGVSGRVLILGFLQSDTEDTETYVVVAWMYSVADARAEGVNLLLPSGKTHALSSHAQVLVWNEVGLRLWNSERAEMDLSQIVDFSTKPAVRRFTLDTAKPCAVRDALNEFRPEEEDEEDASELDVPEAAEAAGSDDVNANPFNIINGPSDRDKEAATPTPSPMRLALSPKSLARASSPVSIPSRNSEAPKEYGKRPSIVGKALDAFSKVIH